MQKVDYRSMAYEIKGEKLPYPAKQSNMRQQPDSDLSFYKAAAKLEDKVAIISGGDARTGRAVAIIYNENDSDAEETKKLMQTKGKKCLTIKANVRRREACFAAVDQTVKTFGKLYILINNAAFQKTQASIEYITEAQLRRTFETNIFAYFFMAQAALPHLSEGDSIVNTGSIVGLRGHELLLATKHPSIPPKAHTIGTCWMGTSSDQAVVNSVGRSFDIQNLYNYDSSIFSKRPMC